MMIEQEQRKYSDEAWEARRRRAGIVAFLVGLVATLVFFGFFPGPFLWRLPWAPLLDGLARPG